MKSSKEYSKNLAIKSKEIIWFFGLHAFSLILLFVFLELIYGGFIFYKYVALVETAEPKVVTGVLKFDEIKYQRVINEIQLRKF